MIVATVFEPFWHVNFVLVESFLPLLAAKAVVKVGGGGGGGGQKAGGKKDEATRHAKARP